MSGLLRRSEKVDVRFVVELRRVRDAGLATRPLLLRWKRGDKSSGATKPYALDATRAGRRCWMLDSVFAQCVIRMPRCAPMGTCN